MGMGIRLMGLGIRRMGILYRVLGSHQAEAESFLKCAPLMGHYSSKAGPWEHGSTTATRQGWVLHIPVVLYFRSSLYLKGQS